MKFKSELDKDFSPIILGWEDFQKRATKPFGIAIEDADGFNYRFKCKIGSSKGENYFFIERIVKSLLWIVGGYKIYLAGNGEISERIRADYEIGARVFDAGIVKAVYDRPVEIITCEHLPKLKRRTVMAGGNTKGCRIGFDAGGSDRKVSAVIDGEVVFSEEVVWHPKINADPQYHFDGILSALKTAAAKMPKVDSIGVSSAGIYINNRTCVASLFKEVPKEQFHLVRNIYERTAEALGKNIPVTVANDGDVTAIAGGMMLKSNGVLGIAMGTSQAGGYLNADGGLNGWLSELAFAPCDISAKAVEDPWSGDFGTGVNYFSQDAVIKLCPEAGINLDPKATPAEKLSAVQELMKKQDPRAKEIYRTIGIYLGYTLPFYSLFYDIKYALVLGRVLSGAGGDLIVSTAIDVLKTEFPDCGIQVVTPDENFKRVGQSIAASSL
ncbi:MAG: ROK family protein [Firmicutes bacterium]|nr:ROK family protein [Bacillota bacterium]